MLFRSAETGAGLLVVSHDERLLARMDASLRLRAGRLEGDA